MELSAQLDTSELSPTSKSLNIMDESLEFIFTAMMDQGEILDAVDFLRGLPSTLLPSETVMRTLIFEILWKSDNVRCLAFASDYLVSVLKAFPSNNEVLREFYFNGVRNTIGYQSDLWNVFVIIVNSFYCHHEIYVVEKTDSSSDPIPYPNCKFLLEFYVLLFTTDFDCCRFDGNTVCLLMKLFWRNQDRRSICLSYKTEYLFKWIDHIYACANINDMSDLLTNMHEVLTLTIRAIIEGNFNLSPQAAFSSSILVDIVECMINFCKNAFSNLTNVKIFLVSLHPLKYLQAKVSEKIIRQIIKQSSKKSYVFTLKDIVEQCMFPPKFNKSKTKHHVPNIDKYLRKRSVDKKVIISDKKMETTVLHELCKEKKIGDLLEKLLESTEDVNTQDAAGNTPLHMAVQSNSLMCVNLLIDKASKGLDYAVINGEGITPLHMAVTNDAVEIAKILLDNGGYELLTVSDFKGQRPNDLCTSKAMENILQPFLSELREPNESESSSLEVSEAPHLKTFRDYSIYLHSLNCLLCTYCDLFNLYAFVWQKNTVVHDHGDKLCCHYLDRDVCSEDATLVTQLIDLIDVFIKSIHQNVSKAENNINVDIELIPLRAFAASLKNSFSTKTM